MSCEPPRPPRRQGRPSASGSGRSRSASAELLGRHVAGPATPSASAAEDAVRALEPGEVLLLENLRFHAGEEKNDAGVREQLAALADLYVNDAFGAAHRAHASTVGVAQLLPALAGFLMEQELEVLCEAARRTRSVRSWRSSAAPRSATRSRSSRTCSEGRRPPHRRRDGEHLPAGAGQAGGQSPPSPIGSRRAGDPGRGGEARGPASSCRVGRHRRQGGHARHRVQDAPRGEGPRHWHIVDLGKQSWRNIRGPRSPT